MTKTSYGLTTGSDDQWFSLLTCDNVSVTLYT